MQRHLIAGVCAAAMSGFAAPAQACIYSPPIDLNDVRHADMVVVGRIVNYRIVRDQEARRERWVLQARWPGLSPQEQRRRAQHSDFLTDFAQFDVVVEQLLVGQAPRVVTVRWNNSTFDEPRSLPGRRYVVALRRLADAAPASPEAGASSRPNPWAGAIVPVQSSCSGAFIFEEESDEARGVLAILSRR